MKYLLVLMIILLCSGCATVKKDPLRKNCPVAVITVKGVK